VVSPSLNIKTYADLVAYGMGEHSIVEIARRLAAGETVRDLRDMRGVAYVLDEAGDFATRCNMELVGLEKPDDEDFATLKSAIEEHAINTKSTRAAKILAEWQSFALKFVKVMPQDYKRVLQSLKKVQSQGLSGEDAIMAAFEENVKGGH